ncbi:beclin-2 [Castor canadensis]|nr:beclin-2 [Castor canadensis]
MSSMRFLCQRCCQPLKLSQPTEVQDSAQRGPADALEEGGPSRGMTDGGEPQARASSRLLSDSGRKFKKSVDHFTLLGHAVSIRTLSSVQKTTADLFDILSGQKDVDHPLCEECTDNLLKQLDTELTFVELDSQNYRRCLETDLLMGEAEKKALQMELQTELQGLELEEARLAQELEAVEESRVQTEADLRAAQAETKELRQQERQHHKDYSALKWQQLELTDQLSSLENQLRHAQHHLHRLRQTDIFNATFEIWEEGPLGIINNFRLGCLPGVPVGWKEINAAWGQVALLLLALSNTVGLKFQRYQLVACGNHSYLKSLTGDCARLPLFSDGSQNVFLNNKFDRAMMAFLDCMQQFKEEAEKGKEGLCLPYTIHVKGGLMEDALGSGECCSIRTHLNTEEQWTRALKFMLINLKWSLSWASIRYRHD